MLTNDLFACACTTIFYHMINCYLDELSLAIIVIDLDSNLLYLSILPVCQVLA